MNMDAWQIADTIAFITKNEATKIALQFPDHLLKQSASIAVLLKQKLLKLLKLSNNNEEHDYKIYIMADTTFAPCCVDEISAQHVKAEVIIHYGWTCCSATNRIPVFHVLGHQTFDIQLLNKLFFSPKIFTQTFASFDKILIIYEPHYNHYKHKLIQLFKHENIEFIISDIHNKSSLRCQSEKQQNENKNNDNEKTEQQSHFCGFYYDNLLDIKQWNKLLQSDNFSINDIKEKYGILYIGNDEFDEYSETPSCETQLYLSLLTNFGSSFKFISYNPNKVQSFFDEEKNNDNYEIDYIFNMKRNEKLLSKMLMYRYCLIEKIKTSDIIGIVCATLVVDNYLDIIKTLKENIRKSGKKSYMFSVGKINQAKLGNFSEIDIFVIITCPMSFAYLLPVQQESFFKNLVTPFDVMFALNDDNDSINWTGMYSTDFNDILNHSFKMGGIKTLSLEKAENEMKDSNICNDKIVATYGKAGGLVKRDATDYMLEKRTWKGVEFISDDVAPSKIEQGLTGIASQYEGEFK